MGQSYTRRMGAILMVGVLYFLVTVPFLMSVIVITKTLIKDETKEND